MVIANVPVLARAMKTANLSRVELAVKMGRHPDTINKIMRGGPVGPNLQQALYEVFGRSVRMDRLFKVVETPPKRRR
jgi:plasmid maintenance system antidote protein VapI